MDATSGRDNDTTKSPSPPDVTSNPTNTSSQSRTTLTNSVSHQATSRPPSQGKLSYASAAKKAVSNERLDSAAGATHGATSNRQPRARDARPANNRTTAVPAAVPNDRQATTQRRDTSRLDVELDAQPRPGQPPADVDNTRNVAAHPISLSKVPDISAWKEARTAKREGRKVTIPAPSLDVRPSQASRNTGSNVSSGPSEPGEQAERKESPLHPLDSSREINTTRPLAQQVDQTASVRTSARPSTSSPPSNRPSAPTTSPPPPLPAPASTEITSGRVHATGSMHTDGSQAQSEGAPLELPHHRGEERGKTPPDGQIYTSHSATLSRLPPPADERAAAATESVSQSLPVSAPRSLDKSVSRREAKRATEGTTSNKKKQKRVAPPEEYETRAEDFATGSDGSKRRNDPPTSNTSNGDAIVSRVEQKPQRARPPSVADSQIKSIPSMSPTVAGSLINQGGHASHESFQIQEVPGFLTKTEQREENATAALEGRYHSEPFIGKSHATFSKFPPAPSGVKQRSALINNEGNFQVGSLNQHLAADKPSSRSGEKYGVPITTGIQQVEGAGSTQPSPSDDGSHGKGPQVSSGGVRRPGRGEPSEQPERREPTQLGSYDDQIRGEGPRGPSGGGPSEDRGKARPDEKSRKDPSATLHSQPPAPPGHTSAMTELSSLQERSTTSVPHRLPVPSVHTHTTTKLSSQQDRKDPFDTPHTPPPSVPPKHTHAATEPLSLKGHEDPPVIPHSLPTIPNGHASTVPEPHSQPLSESVQSHKDKSNSRPKGNEGVHREVTRPTRPPEGSTSGQKAQKEGCWTRFKRWCAEHCCCCC